jgi:hypothetical protein
MGKAAWSFRPSLLISILRVTRKRTVALRVDGGGGSAVPLEGKGPWVGAWQLYFARCRGLKAANKTVNKTVQGFFEDKHRMTKCLQVRPHRTVRLSFFKVFSKLFAGESFCRIFSPWKKIKIKSRLSYIVQVNHESRFCFCFFPWRKIIQNDSPANNFEKTLKKLNRTMLGCGLRHFVIIITLLIISPHITLYKYCLTV